MVMGMPEIPQGLLYSPLGQAVNDEVGVVPRTDLAQAGASIRKVT
ncbi:hypothetical protein SAMN05216223_11651 [Actinacidiphila yanglinensis]|uniref:Uncharacterized protein n=1 Tax=Actinacidiphila yanglinensis TaxID=310779 RepID=A0A1H6DJD7_9ACTN|nr:hypothetical protein SAMN05216223_11651 [Actinacidiphila yanglinensis]